MEGTEGYDIIYVDKPDESVWGLIGGGIEKHNTQHAGDDQGRPLCFLLRGPDGKMAGGLIGATHWDWFHIDLMWIRDALRGRGYGRGLLTRAEDEARRRGAKNVYLDTFSFQAPGFYERHGYRVFGELRDFPAGHHRYFLTKEL